jgi:FtsH-binding integral membrane protein
MLVRPALAVAAMAGGTLLVVGDLSSIRIIDVGTSTLTEVNAGTEDSYLAALMGVVVAPLALAAFRCHRLAMTGLVLIAVLALALVGYDLSHIHDVGLLAARYENVRAHAGPALTLQLIGALLVLTSGWCQLVWSHRRPVRQPAAALAAPGTSLHR